MSIKRAILKITICLLLIFVLWEVISLIVNTFPEKITESDATIKKSRFMRDLSSIIRDTLRLQHKYENIFIKKSIHPIFTSYYKKKYVVIGTKYNLNGLVFDSVKTERSVVLITRETSNSGMEFGNDQFIFTQKTDSVLKKIIIKHDGLIIEDSLINNSIKSIHIISTSIALSIDEDDVNNLCLIHKDSNIFDKRLERNNYYVFLITKKSYLYIYFIFNSEQNLNNAKLIDLYNDFFR